MEEIVGDSSGSGTGIVLTQYGPGTVIEERADKSLVVDLVFGRAFLRPEAIVSRQSGHYASTSMFQLQRVCRVRSLLREDATLTMEHMEYATDACITRYLLSMAWNVDKAATALLKTLHWRFDADGFRPHALRFDQIRDHMGVFPCFIAGHGVCLSDGFPSLCVCVCVLVSIVLDGIAI